MAIFGNIDHLERILAADPRFTSAFPYLKRCLTPGSADHRRIGDIAVDGVEEIALDQGSVAFDQVYVTRGRGDCFFESHRKYIDIQCILEGDEVIDVVAISGLETDKPYREKKDLIKYRDPGAGSKLRLRAGEAAVFFPEDGHMPGQFANASGLVRKTVIKVPVGNK
jgi:biofilm protein TabA